MVLLNRIAVKLLAIFLAMLLIFKAWLMDSLTPVGYSVDIYNQMSVSIVFLTLIIYIYGLLLLDRLKNKVFVSAISLALVLNTLTLILTPKLLGYYLADRGDSLASLGFAKTILFTGHTDKLDIYPLLFIHMATIEDITGISFSNIIWIEITIINLMFILGIYIFVSRNYKNTPLSIILLLCVTPWLQIYHASIIAQFFAYSFLFFWLTVLFEMHKNNYRRWNFILLLTSVFLVFAHPFVIAYAIIVLFAWILANYFVEKKAKYTIVLILMVISGTWVVNNYMLLKSLSSLPSYLHGLFIAGQIEYSLKATNLSFIETLKYAFIRFLPQITLTLTIILLIILIVLYEKFPIRSVLKEASIALTLIGAFYSGFLFLMKHGYDRIIGLNFTFFGFTALLAHLWSVPLTRKKLILIKKSLQIALTLILAFSVFSVFLSPINGFPFSGITNSEIVGFSFAFSKMSSEDKLIDPIGESKRWSIWYYGYSKTFEIGRVFYLYRLPDHFGYDKVNNFAENEYILKIEHNVFGKFEKYRYDYSKLIVGVPKSHIEWYEKVQTYKVIGRFNYRDLSKLRSDSTVDQIYTNNEHLIFKVNQ